MRPDSISGTTERIKCGCGKLYITVNKHDDGYKELFIWLGKAGGCSMCWCDAVGRLATFAMNAGTPMSDIVKALKGISCPNPINTVDGRVLSCPDAIATILEKQE